jgi:hypothetical protein
MNLSTQGVRMMFTRSKRTALRVIALLGAILPSAALGIALTVSDHTSTVSDPIGDANFNAQAFQDVVFVQVTQTAGGDFELLMEMAGPVPANPPLSPPGHDEILWVWNFDLDPTTFPAGYPYLKASGPAEFSVHVSWDGTEFVGAAVDRRPLLTGGEAVITPVTFSINGTIVQADLPYALIGAVPASFGWFAGTSAWSGPLGLSEGHHLVDVAVFRP